MGETSIGTVIEECIQSKRASNRRGCYVDGLEGTIRRFARGLEELPISIVQAYDVERWLDGHTAWKPATRRMAMIRLSVLFSFARRRGYIERNPVQLLDPIIVEEKPPPILKPDEVPKFIQATRAVAPFLMASTLLGLYTGLRTAEIRKLKWADVHLDRAFIQLDAAASKVRRRRIVALEPKAVGLLSTVYGQPIPEPHQLHYAQTDPNRQCDGMVRNPEKSA